MTSEAAPAVPTESVTRREQRLDAAPPAVTVTDLHKSFSVPRHRPTTLKERSLHPLRRAETRDLHALRGTSFEVRTGEFFGIVGRNGSGKSTMLKVLAGIYRPDAGSVSVAGRLSPFIELGVGFNMEMNARDNVAINATLLGISRSEAMERFDDIVRFAELGDFVDLKLKNYSSGMQVRLGFATAIQVDADVLLLDEVLAVGDARFQEKCFDVFRQLKDAGKTIVLVTHDLTSVERFCDRALLLEEGSVDVLGEPRDVVHRYQELTADPEADDAAEGWGETKRWGDKGAEILDAWVLDAEGRRAPVVGQGERIAICFDVQFHNPMAEPVFGITMRNEEGRNVFVTNTQWNPQPTGSFDAGERAEVQIAVDNTFSVGRWFVSPAVAYQDTTRMADWRERLLSFSVQGRRWTGGTVDPPHEIVVRRS
ncbi:MAG: ABC transporter ATP-binding protein [Solirubrobacterales bacterium]